MLSPAPANHEGELTDKVLSEPGQADGDDVLLEDHVPGQSHQGHVVPEVCRAVQGVDVLGFDLEVLVRQPLRLLPDVPLPEPHLHPVGLSAEEQREC